MRATETERKRPQAQMERPAGIITSRSNERIKRIRALANRRERERTGLFFVDSARLVAEAAAQGADIQTLVAAPERAEGPFAREALRRGRERAAEYLEVSGEVFDALASREGGQGVGAVMRQRWEMLAGVAPGPDLCWVAVEGVQYPGNLGTILRACDAVGAGGVVLLGPATDPYDPAAVRASLGAVFSQRLARANLDELAAWKRRHDAFAVGGSPSGRADFRACAYRRPLLLVMGCEHAGLSASALALCDEVVRIPMVGRCDSLNLAIATSLLLYAAFDRCISPRL